MAYGGSESKRGVSKTNPGRPGSWAGWVSLIFEAIGILNKGSWKAQAAPDASEAAKLQPISSNALNVTRVGGIGALISSAGVAALALFKVNKAHDRASIVVAAYVSVGVIVAAALFTVAIIIAADIRARTSVATAVSPAPERAGVKRVTAGGTTSLDQVYEYVLVSAAAADVELTLPSAGTVSWQQMTIKREDGDATHTVTLRPQAQQTIAGQTQQRLDPASLLQVYSDGQAWLAV